MCVCACVCVRVCVCGGGGGGVFSPGSVIVNLNFLQQTYKADDIFMTKKFTCLTAVSKKAL